MGTLELITLPRCCHGLIASPASHRCTVEAEIEATMRTIITDEGRLTRYLHAEFGEVFATGSDPQELDNRYAQPGGRPLQERLSEQLFQQMLSHIDHSRHPTHMA
jgi:hypothetical protein